MITIVNYGLGNFGSLLNMLKKIGVKAVISSDVSGIKKSKKLILPGVGAFDEGMKNLNKSGMRPILNYKVFKEKTPILGICLGMQLFTKKSEEGKLGGLGLIEAETKKFRSNKEMKVPHMGWNRVIPFENNPLFKNMEEEIRFYFAHSYHVCCEDKKDVAAITNYGYDFASVVMKDNIIGVQFHPEKSHKFGMRLLKNFAELC